MVKKVTSCISFVISGVYLENYGDLRLSTTVIVILWITAQFLIVYT